MKNKVNCLNDDTMSGVEDLIHKIFKVKNYNNLVRPVDKKNNVTNVVTELKILQIDLVIIIRGSKKITNH